MRFVAAFMVLFGHVLSRLMPNTFVYADGVNALWQTFGRMGVSFFFILSGFVLTWSARPDRSVIGFWRRRACKIIPNHLVTAAVVTVLLLATGESVTAGTLIPNLLLVHAWSPQLEVTFSINPVSWSLACEAFFYLCFPILLFWISRIREQRLWAWTTVIFAAIWAVPMAADLLLPNEPPLLPGFEYSIIQDWFVYTLPATRALEFVIGIFVARLVMSGRWPEIGLLTAALSVPIFCLVTLSLPGVYAVASSMMVLPLALMVAAGAMADVTSRRTFMRNRVMVWLGEVSFALYMVHVTVIIYGGNLLGFSQKSDTSTILAFAMVIPFLVVSLVFAWLLYRFVERPVMRRWSGGRSRIDKRARL